MTQEITLQYLLIENQKEIYTQRYSTIDAMAIRSITKTLLNDGYEVLDSTADLTALLDHAYGQTVTIYLREKESIVFANAPKNEGEAVAFSDHLEWPQGVAKEDLNKTVTRTVLFLHEDGRQVFEPVLQDVYLSRAARVNHVTQQVTYMNWTIAGRQSAFDAVTVPQLLGYQPSVAYLSQEAISLEEADHKTVRIIFHPEPRKAFIRVIEKTSKAVLTEEVYEGRTGERIAYSKSRLMDHFVAKGYDIVTNDLDDAICFSAQGDDTYTIGVQPRLIEFQPTDDLPKVGDPVYPELSDSVKWPKGLSYGDLNREVTREVIFQFEDGSQAQEPVCQTLRFHRRAILNLLTGELHYGSWEGTGSTFDSLVPTPMPGYMAKPRVVAEVTGITAKNDNRREVVSYAKVIQKVEVHFIEQADQPRLLYKKTLTGKSGELLSYDPIPKIQEFLASGYDVVVNDFPTDGSFGYETANPTVYVIKLSQRVLRVLSNDPKEAGSFVDGQDKGPRWPSGVAQDDLNKEIKRNINYLFEDNTTAFPAVVDTVTFSRDATVNLVTNEVVYGEWNHDHLTLSEKQIPVLEGYHTSRQYIPTIQFTTAFSDVVYTIRYLKDAVATLLRVYDPDHQQVLFERQTFSQLKEDLLGELKQVSRPLLEQGYAFVGGDFEQSYHYTTTEDEIQLLMKPVIQDITSANPKAPFTAIEGYPRLTWPKGLEDHHLVKTVTRTIHYQDLAGERLLPSTVQVVTFRRTASVVLVTGEITYGPWQSDQAVMDAVTSPTIEGYVPHMDGIVASHVHADALDEVYVISYQRQPQTIEIQYIHHETHKVLAQDKLVAMVSESLPYHPDERLGLLGLLGYRILDSNCPSHLEVSDCPVTYQVYVAERMVQVTWQDPKQAYSLVPLEDGSVFTWPKGLEKTDLYYESYRRIRYLDEQGQALRDDVVQVCHFYRDAMVNLATSVVSYGPWESSQSQFEAVSSPILPGYQADHEGLPALELEAHGYSQTLLEEVFYHKVPYRFIVQVEDVVDASLLEVLEIVVKSGDVPAYSLDQLITYYQAIGYELSETIIPEELDAHSQEQRISLLLSPRSVVVSLEDVKHAFGKHDSLDTKLLQSLSGLTVYDLSRQIKRTIHYVYQKGGQVAPAFEATVQFERQATVNLVTGEIAYGSWYSAYPIFDEVYSPIVQGYQADVEVSPAIEQLTEDDGDKVEVVVYSPAIQDVVVNIINKTTGDLLYVESIPEQVDLDQDERLVTGTFNLTEQLKAVKSLEQTGGSVPPILPEEPAVSEEALAPTDKPNKVLAYLKDLFLASDKPEQDSSKD